MTEADLNILIIRHEYWMSRKLPRKKKKALRMMIKKAIKESVDEFYESN